MNGGIIKIMQTRHALLNQLHRLQSHYRIHAQQHALLNQFAHLDIHIQDQLLHHLIKYFSIQEYRI